MANLAYMTTKQLRKSNIDAELFMEKNPIPLADPLVFDPSLKGKYPEWISFFDKTKSSWKFDVIKKMRQRKYDLLHAYVELPIFANFSGKPLIVQTQGSDLRELAQSNSVRGFLLRKAYKKAKTLLFYQPDYYPILKKMNLKKEIFLPPFWDTSFFREKTSSIPPRDQFVIFHPSNLDWRLKGNDKLILGYQKFLEKYPRSMLIIVERGPDSQRTRSLVKECSLTDNVEFISGPLKTLDLLEYYNHADVIADQFILGSLGSIAWEVFLCSKPLLGFIHIDYFEKLYGESPPMCVAQSPDEISKKLELLHDEKFRKEIGAKAREWITKYHSPDLFTKKLTYIYNSILEGLPISEIQEKVSKFS